MIVKTKKYQLPKKTYIRVAFFALLKRQWWYIVGPLSIASLAFAFPEYKWWFITPAILLIIGYILFWLIQFAGVTQLPQGQILFEKFWYEIDSQKIILRLDARRGSHIQWDMIKFAYKNKDHFLLVINKVQIIHLPFKIFNHENDIRFLETVLKRKEYIK
ncbi:MAG: YcxB family protein [Cytophagaceae bacterium]|nr:YcxB family protein [Cytophagaceae bacterium]MDW8457371.1 YcxB family protein [Cytophagaceae bacterium]